jgi:hypothetical protein
VVLLPVCLVVFAGVCFAQGNQTAKPDLGGTWELDPGASNISKKTQLPRQIKITHHDPELIIRRTVIINGAPEERDFTYYTDGRGEMNLTTESFTMNPGSKSSQPSQTQSKTTCSNDKVVTRWVSRFYSAAIIDFENVIEWRLSRDGKTLTKRTTITAIGDLTANLIDPVSRHNPTADYKTVYKLVSK